MKHYWGWWKGRFNWEANIDASVIGNECQITMKSIRLLEGVSKILFARTMVYSSGGSLHLASHPTYPNQHHPYRRLSNCNTLNVVTQPDLCTTGNQKQLYKPRFARSLNKMNEVGAGTWVRIFDWWWHIPAGIRKFWYKRKGLITRKTNSENGHTNIPGLCPDLSRWKISKKFITRLRKG